VCESEKSRIGSTTFSILVCDRSFDLDIVRDGDELIVGSRGGATRDWMGNPGCLWRRGSSQIVF
jgi:hypothetical protein